MNAICWRGHLFPVLVWGHSQWYRRWICPATVIRTSFTNQDSAVSNALIWLSMTKTALSYHELVANFALLSQEFDKKAFHCKHSDWKITSFTVGMLIRYFGYRDFNNQAAQVSYFFLNYEMEPSFDLIGN